MVLVPRRAGWRRRVAPREASPGPPFPRTHDANSVPAMQTIIRDKPDGPHPEVLHPGVLPGGEPRRPAGAPTHRPDAPPSIRIGALAPATFAEPNHGAERRGTEALDRSGEIREGRHRAVDASGNFKGWYRRFGVVTADRPEIPNALPKSSRERRDFKVGPQGPTPNAAPASSRACRPVGTG